jgi:hypothetical protein
MCPEFGAVGRLCLHLPVRAKECDYVQRNQCERDDGPAAAFHVFVAQRDEHGEALSVGFETRDGLFRL